MKSPVGWVLPAIAAAAAALAVVANKNLPVAVASAAIAVLAASLLFAQAWSARAPPPPELPAALASDADRLRLAFRSGRIGREEIAITLNRLERSFRDPGLAALSPAELVRVANLTPEEFVRYVGAGLDRLEVAS